MNDKQTKKYLVLKPKFSVRMNPENLPFCLWAGLVRARQSLNWIILYSRRMFFRLLKEVGNMRQAVNTWIKRTLPYNMMANYFLQIPKNLFFNSPRTVATWSFAK